MDELSFDAFASIHDAWDGSVRKDSWEQARLLAYNMSRPYFKHPLTIEGFYPLKWDKKTEAPKSTRERFDRINNKVKKFIKNGR